MSQDTNNGPRVVVIGGGPAGLMAADKISQAGIGVDLYDSKASVGRKFLLAGKGGLNLTHSEPYANFIQRYAPRQGFIDPLLQAFDAQALRDWCHDLGFDTYVGSSGRVYPTQMKAAPILREWLKRLKSQGVRMHMHHRFIGWNAKGAVRLETEQGEVNIQADALVLALGGGSWPRLGSDGLWVAPLEAQGIQVAPLKPANCGFECVWSDYFKQHFQGQPLKSVALQILNSAQSTAQLGELLVTEWGLEGSLIYALSSQIRTQIEQHGQAEISLDLLPHLSLEAVIAALDKPRGSRSLANHLRRTLKIDGVKAALLRESISATQMQDTTTLAQTLKALRLTLQSARPIEEAISSAGGVLCEQLDANLMLKDKAGVFIAGEMLDWEAPTGGYLLTACFAMGRQAGLGVVEYIQNNC